MSGIRKSMILWGQIIFVMIVAIVALTAIVFIKLAQIKKNYTGLHRRVAFIEHLLNVK